MAKLAPRNVRLRKSAKSTIGRFWISSATTNSASKITDAKSFSRVISADQPMRLAPISAQMRQKRPPPNKSMPAMSSLCASGSRDSSTASIASQMSAAPTGIFTRKAQRQPNPEVMSPLADRFGRRRMLIVGLAIFTLASLLCGLAPSALVLNAARALQGVGAAIELSAALAVLGHEFRGAERAKAFGFWGTVVGGAGRHQKRGEG